MVRPRLLIVENDTNGRTSLSLTLSRHGYNIVTTKSVKEGLSAFQEKPFDLILADLKWPGEEGLQLLDEVKGRSPQTPIIMMTSTSSVQYAVEAMRKGAFDYLLKPVPLEILQERIEKAFRGNMPCSEISAWEGIPGELPLLTKDRKMKEILSLCDRIASSNAPVLIQGESGTGKELLARYIHRKSPRHQKPFIAINCASLPESLFESELFGHEKGAFTGAQGKKIGKFELAHQGTLLLDEITEMSPFLQAKLLRVIQENEVDRIGGHEPIPIDVRVIATTNRDIESFIEKGRFREDLYFRLNVISIHLLPLRDRREDIELLTQYFLKKYSEQYGKPGLTLSEEALQWLNQQPWRGNVRELKNVVERAVLTASTSLLELDHFCQKKEDFISGSKGTSVSSFSLKEMEKHLIFKALNRTNGNRTQAAKILGISIRTLRNKLHEYRETASKSEALTP